MTIHFDTDLMIEQIKELLAGLSAIPDDYTAHGAAKPTSGSLRMSLMLGRSWRKATDGYQDLIQMRIIGSDQSVILEERNALTGVIEQYLV